MRLTPYCLALLLCCPEFALAAPPPATADKKTLAARFVAEAPVLDGILDEKVWAEGEAGTGFVQREPDTGKAASQRTEVRVVYTSTTLYIGLYAYDNEAHRIIDKEMQRDQPLWRDDAIDVVIDTFGRSAERLPVRDQPERRADRRPDQRRRARLQPLVERRLAGRVAADGRGLVFRDGDSVLDAALRSERDRVGTERAPLHPPARGTGLLVADPARRRRQARLAVRKARPASATPSRDGAST